MGPSIPSNFRKSSPTFDYPLKSSSTFEHAKSRCDSFYNDCDIIVEIMKNDGRSIFEIGKLDQFNDCPDKRKTQAEMGIKLRSVFL